MSLVVENGDKKRKDSESGTENEDTEPHFEPLVTLPEIHVSTNEEHEEELIKLRAKLFRFDTSDTESPEWKERGTGEVKLLKHKENHSVRVVMRRDKTLKICANHFITPWMELKPSVGSNRAWVWTVVADFADEIAKPEFLAIRFASAEIANQWKNKFDEARKIVEENCELYKNNTSCSSLETTYSDEEPSKQAAKEDKNKSSKGEETVINKIAELHVSE